MNTILDQAASQLSFHGLRWTLRIQNSWLPGQFNMQLNISTPSAHAFVVVPQWYRPYRIQVLSHFPWFCSEFWGRFTRPVATFAVAVRMGMKKYENMTGGAAR